MRSESATHAIIFLRKNILKILTILSIKSNKYQIMDQILWVEYRDVSGIDFCVLLQKF